MFYILPFFASVIKKVKKKNSKKKKKKKKGFSIKKIYIKILYI